MVLYHRVVTADDIPGTNDVASDGEPLLAKDKVSYYGQPIGVVYAGTCIYERDAVKYYHQGQLILNGTESRQQAAAAREKVKVKYTNVKKPVLTIKEAIEAGSVFPATDPFPGEVSCGDAQGKR